MEKECPKPRSIRAKKCERTVKITKSHEKAELRNCPEITITKIML